MHDNIINMRNLLFIGVLLYVLLLPSALAISTPNVTFIPSQISANASFIAIADAGLSNPTRVSWIVPGVGDVFYGSFPRTDNNFACYFSNTDATATCGPTPFTFSTIGFDPFTMQIDSINQYGETGNVTLDVAVGGIKLTPDISINDTHIYMVIYPSGGMPLGVNYAVYNENLTLYSGYKSMEKDIKTGWYTGNFAILPGSYFIAFSATSSSNFGGGVSKITIPGGGEVCTIPENGKSKEEYVITADDVSLSKVYINKNQKFEQKGFKMTNIGNETVSGLTVSVPSAISSYLSIILEETTLAPNDTGFFNVKLDNIENSMNINTVVDITSGTDTVGEISVNIPVSVIGAAACAVSGSLSVQPQIWTGEFLTDEGAEKTFSLSNNGDSDLTDLSYSTTGNIEDVITVSLPSSITAGEAGDVEVSLDSDYTDNYQGLLVVEAGDDSVSILINANFYPDMSFQITDLSDRLGDVEAGLSEDNLLLLESSIEDIRSLLDSTQLSFDSGDYMDAEKSFIEAQSQIGLLEDVSYIPFDLPDQPVVGETDLTLVVGVIVAVVVIILVFIFFKKFKKPKTTEEEFDEEFEEEPLEE
jgi:hypothetical protein